MMPTILQITFSVLTQMIDFFISVPIFATALGFIFIAFVALIISQFLHVKGGK